MIADLAAKKYKRSYASVVIRIRQPRAPFIPTECTKEEDDMMGNIVESRVDTVSLVDKPMSTSALDLIFKL